MQSQISTVGASKRKIEGEVQALQTELDSTISEIQVLDDRGKKASADALRLAEELRQEHGHASHLERQLKAAETQIKELQSNLEQAEAAALKGGKRSIQQLEQRVGLQNFKS